MLMLWHYYNEFYYKIYNFIRFTHIIKDWSDR